jgi:hypothetical protein
MVNTGTLVTMLAMVTTRTLVTMVNISGNYASHENHKTVAIPTMVTTGKLVAMVNMLAMITTGTLITMVTISCKPR